MVCFSSVNVNFIHIKKTVSQLRRKRVKYKEETKREKQQKKKNISVYRKIPESKDQNGTTKKCCSNVWMDIPNTIHQSENGRWCRWLFDKATRIMCYDYDRKFVRIDVTTITLKNL